MPTLRSTQKKSRAQSAPAEQLDSGEVDVDSDNPDGTADNLDAVIPPHTPQAMPIIGLGGSAGAIPALRAFFTLMPADSGMAFVVIIHLSPEHESSLPEILQANTAMPVIGVTEPTRVVANHVYVIPPSIHLSMNDGFIIPQPLEPERGRRVAVDLFFRSLADTHGTSAVAIVLSGADSDGVIGLKRLKERGGLTIAQDPGEAEHDSMPRSAIATGMVDWIMPVEMMPERLVAFQKNEKQLRLPPEAIDAHDNAQQADAQQEYSAPVKHKDESALREVLMFLRARTGHDFRHYKRATVLRRIGRRLQVNSLPDIPSYLEFMRTNPGEAGALLHDLLISVINFFRDPETFGAVREMIPRIFDGKSNTDQVRVWVAGCATGEEAYSVAMMLLEYSAKLPSPPSILIFATDLSAEAIHTAREGRYPETIEADVSPERLRRFFIHDLGFYRVRKEVRECVLFAPHNLLSDSPFSRLDLVTCRNLLIYLNREAQQRAFETFHFALRHEGVLFLGTSESADEVSHLFSSLDKKHRVYKKRMTARQLMPPLPISASPPIVAAPPTSSRRESTPDAGKIAEEAIKAARGDAPISRRRAGSFGDLHLQLLERYAPPSVVVSENYDILHMSETAGRFLRYAGGEPSTNLLQTVHPSLRSELSSALFTAIQRGEDIRIAGVPMEEEGVTSSVDIQVRPVPDTDDAGRGLVVVFFQEIGDATPTTETSTPAQGEPMTRRLEYELQHVKATLRVTAEQYEASLEELKASNEELQASNEEAQSTTEELETSKEELQAVNEELSTVNHELKSTLDTVGRANSDLQNLMVSTEIATVFLDRQLHIKRYTPRAARIFNIIPSDVERPLSDLTHTLEYSDLAQDAAQVLDELTTLERELSTGDGQWFLTRLLPYRAADNRIDGVVLTFLDITARKQAEADKAFLASIVETSGDSIITIDFDGVITSWNKAAEKLYGYPSGEVLGKPLTMLTLPEDLQQILGNIEKIKHSWKVETFDTVRVRKGGREIHLEIVMSPVKDEAGNVIGGSTVARDVTARKEAEEALRESEEQFRRAIEDAPIPVIMHAEDGEVLQISRTWTKMTGYTLQDIPNVDAWLNLAYGEGANAVRAHMQDLFTGDKSTVGVEFAIRTRDEPDRHWSFSASSPGTLRDGRRFIVGMAVDITERVRGEAALRASEEKYRSLFESMDEAYAVVEVIAGESGQWSDFLFLDANPAFIKHTGMEHPVGKTASELLGTPNPRWAAIYGQVADTGEPLRLEETEPVLGRTFDLNVFRFNGSDRRVAVLFTDITERKRAEAALRENEQRLSAIFANASVGLCEVSLDGRFVRVNEELCKTLKRSSDQLRRMSVADVTHPHDVAASFAAVRKVIETGKPASVSKRYLTPDGTFIFANSNLTLLTDESGEPASILAVTVDYTARHIAEQSLWESEERFRLLVEGTKEYAMFLMDTERRIIHWNSGAERVLGFTRDEVAGKKGDIIFTPEDREAGIPDAEVKTAIEKGHALDRRWHLRKDGSRFWADGVMSSLRDDSGKLRGFVKIARDATQEWEAQEELRRAHAEMEQHVVERTLELAQANTELRRHTEHLQRVEAERQLLMQRLVVAQEDERKRLSRELHDQMGQTLTALKVGLSAQHPVQTEGPGKTVDLNRLLDDLAQQVHSLAWELRPALLDNFGLKAALEQYVAEWTKRSGISADFASRGFERARRMPPHTETAFYRVVQEALTNVLRHAEAAQVSVVLERAGNEVRVVIEDNGKGFKAGKRSVRGKRGSSAKGIALTARSPSQSSSQRLGLVGMRERMELIGGTLTIESKIGQGTTVYARAPFERRSTPR